MPDAVATREHTAQANPRRPISSTRRGDLEGLRALAVVLIVVYHIYVGRVSGGVDVFFVLSGFLVTTMLLGHLDAFGRIRPLRFAARTSARLVPGVLVVILAVAAASYAFEPPWRRSGAIGELAWAATFNMSWLLSSTSVDYLAQGEPASPVQHLWAIALQVRFYAIWLAIIGIVGLLMRGRHQPRVLLGAFVAVILVSFTYSVHLTAVDQARAYFNVTARLWEFAAGGLVAIALTRLERIQSGIRASLGWVGLALVASCGVVFTVSRSFPGWAALWPVVGAMLLIAAGTGVIHRPWSPTRVLSSRWLVALGGVSFALYLWHWPLLVFYRGRFGQGPLEVVPGLLLILLAIVLASISTHVVERPLRSWAHSQKRVGYVVLAALAAVVSVATPAYAMSRVTADIPAIPSDRYPGAVALKADAGGAMGSSDFAPDPIAASEDFPRDVLDGCGTGDGFVATTCTLGRSDARAKVALVGGSHSAQWLPALEGIASRNNWSLLVAVKGGCRFADGADAQAEGDPACQQWSDDLLRYLMQIRPDLVVTTATVSSFGGEAVPDGFLTAWRALATAGIPVVGLRDTPRWPTNPLDCLSENPDRPDRCYVSRDMSLAKETPSAAHPLPPNLATVDMTDLLCTGGICPAVIGHVVVYRDDDHLTASYARSTESVLADRLRAASLEAGASPALFTDQP